jgi:endogenous inhibitor of DNA gyrase (YacG/DUF329 family)
MSVPKRIKCPTCKKAGDWFATDFGPFCSQRCKLIDLGKWLGEENRISEPLRPEHFSGYENLPPGQHLDQPEG